jgi:hypothetical protein
MNNLFFKFEDFIIALNWKLPLAFLKHRKNQNLCIFAPIKAKESWRITQIFTSVLPNAFRHLITF